MPHKDILNYIPLSDRIATSGQPEEGQFKHIRAAGYQVVINLAMPDSNNAVPVEGNRVTAHKMNYVHIPVPFEAPNQQHLQQFFAVMQAFKDKKVWVHCVMNYRVSAFMYLYLRQVERLSEQEAQQALHPSWQPNDVWRSFMEEGCKGR